MNAEQKRQFEFLKKDPGAYGGELYKTRQNRARPRPLSTRHSLHLVLRSTQARGPQAFSRHEEKINALLQKFSAKHRIHVYSHAVQSNHLHIHLHVPLGRASYKRFIRGFTAALAMLVTKASRFRPLKQRFWDQRPFTRLVRSAAAFNRIKKYIRINFLESYGCNRDKARLYADLEAGVKIDWG